MTIDEAIRHCEEVAERYETRAKIIDRRKLGFALENPTACHECAADHRQLAEWLTDYKELREKYREVVMEGEILNADYTEQVALNEQYKNREEQYKRLLKAAVEDMNSNNICFDINACNVCTEKNCISCDTFKWRYTDEALRLIES